MEPCAGTEPCAQTAEVANRSRLLKMVVESSFFI